MMENENWKDVKEFSNYQVSNLGRVRIVAHSKEVTVHYPERIYNKKMMPFWKDKKQHIRSTAKLVREHFGENEENNIWKDIAEFPNYQISNDGKIKVLAYSITKILTYPEKLVPIRSGGQVAIFYDGKRYCRSANKLKRIAFDEIVTINKAHRRKRTTIKF